MEFVLSLFTGIGLFDAAFKNADFCVVSAGDPKDGEHWNIAKFKGIPNKFDGILITSPCQEFSKANRAPNFDLGCAYITEAVRIIFECGPNWCIFENVEGCPDIHIFGYKAQRFFLNDSHVFGVQDRNRRFQFLHKEGNPLIILRNITKNGVGLSSCVTTRSNLSISEMSKLMGFPNLTLEGYSTSGAKRAIGNGVPWCIGTTIAHAIKHRNRDLSGTKLCACGCGEVIKSEIAKSRYDSCRKRIERLRTHPNKALFYCPQGVDSLKRAEAIAIISNLITPKSVDLNFWDGIY